MYFTLPTDATCTSRRAWHATAVVRAVAQMTMELSVEIVEVVAAVAACAVCTAYTAYIGDQAFACWSQ